MLFSGETFCRVHFLLHLVQNAGNLLPQALAAARLPDPAAAAPDPAATAAVVTRAVNAALAAQAQQPSGPNNKAAKAAGVKRAAGGAASDASSSEEDSSDEAYAARHAPWELEERTRFMTYQLGVAHRATVFSLLRSADCHRPF